CGRRGGDLDHRHVLEPASLVSRLETRLLETLDDIGGGLFLAGARRLAALESVGREGLGHALQRIDRDGRRRCLSGGDERKKREQVNRASVRHEVPPVPSSPTTMARTMAAARKLCN